MDTSPDYRDLRNTPSAAWEALAGGAAVAIASTGAPSARRDPRAGPG